MKRLILLAFAALLFTACQQQEQRYFAESTETKALKAGISAYESGEWDTWRSHFADTAKVYVNSKEGMTIDARLAELKGMTSAFKSYGFNHDKDHIEMVKDKQDETWVYYWAGHKGTMNNGKELEIPVHLAVRFIDGKIVAEHVYFDGTELNKELEAMAMASETATAEQ